MSLEFAAPDYDGPLSQGEVLVNIWEHRALSAALEHDEGAVQRVESRNHPFVVVVSPECDLLHDYAARFPDNYNFGDGGMEERFRASPEQYYVDHILLCDAFEEKEIRAEGKMKSDIFRRVRNNQDKRFHHLGPAPIVGMDNRQLDLYLDFKSIFSLTSNTLYSAVLDNIEMRLAVVPPIYLHDLIHRFYSYQSRVGLPD